MIWCMHIPCWIPNATNAHSCRGILTAFPLQQWLNKHAAVLYYTHTASVTIFLYLVFTYGCILNLPNTLKFPLRVGGVQLLEKQYFIAIVL